MPIDSRLEIKQLRLLQALLRERNVSRVAAQVGLTQQAVSDQLKKMREIFGNPLFVRKSNGLVPTPLAEDLSEKIDGILQQLESLVVDEHFDPAQVDTRYVIAATDYAQLIVLPTLLAKIRQQAPKLKVIIRDLNLDDLHQHMASGAVHLALAFPDFTPRSYPFETLFSEHYVCVTASDSPLKGKTLSLKALAKQPQIIASPSRPNFKGSIDDWLESSGAKRNIVISAPCFSVIPLYLQTTDAIAFLPSRAAIGANLCQLPLKEKPDIFDVIAAWHPRSSQSPLHLWLIELLRQQYAS